MSWLCWLGLHAWDWRFTRFDPVGGRMQAVRVYRCNRCNTGREVR